MARRVAVIGASNDRRKFGNRAVRAFRRQGFEVLPVNPHEAVIEGLAAYHSVDDIPGTIDMATFYVPAAVGLRIIEAVARRQVPEVWFNPGSESDALVARARALGIEPIEACSMSAIGESPLAD